MAYNVLTISHYIEMYNRLFITKLIYHRRTCRIPHFRYCQDTAAEESLHFSFLMFGQLDSTR